MEENDRALDKELGFAVANVTVKGALVTGAGGLLFAFFSALVGEPVAGAICLLAAGVAFGLLANAIYRR